MKRKKKPQIIHALIHYVCYKSSYWTIYEYVIVLLGLVVSSLFLSHIWKLLIFSFTSLDYSMQGNVENCKPEYHMYDMLFFSSFKTSNMQIKIYIYKRVNNGLDNVVRQIIKNCDGFCWNKLKKAYFFLITSRCNKYSLTYISVRSFYDAT